MAYYGNDVNQQQQPVQKELKTKIPYIDGSFYPFLKLLLNKACGVPNKFIYIRGYGENDPFLDTSIEPKVFVELISFDTPAMSGELDGLGNVSAFSSSTYMVYFVNDIFRSPILFESSIKLFSETMSSINDEFKKVYANSRSVSLPKIISLKKEKIKMEFNMGLYPIVVYSVYMAGVITHNLDELKNTPFNDVKTTLKLRSNNES